MPVRSINERTSRSSFITSMRFRSRNVLLRSVRYYFARKTPRPYFITDKIQILYAYRVTNDLHDFKSKTIRCKRYGFFSVYPYVLYAFLRPEVANSRLRKCQLEHIFRSNVDSSQTVSDRKSSVDSFPSEISPI